MLYHFALTSMFFSCDEWRPIQKPNFHDRKWCLTFAASPIAWDYPPFRLLFLFRSFFLLYQAGLDVNRCCDCINICPAVPPFNRDRNGDKLRRVWQTFGMQRFLEQFSRTPPDLLSKKKKRNAWNLTPFCFCDKLKTMKTRARISSLIDETARYP